MAPSLARATSLMAVLLLLSKGVGFLRESVVAGAYGAGLVKDANTVAYILPALFLIMLGGLNGPFHLATMGAVTRLEARGEGRQVPGVLLTILFATALLTGALALTVALAAPWVVALTGPRLGVEAQALAIEQLRIMSPLIMIGGLIGALCGISNVRGHFGLSSLTPMVSSLAVIAVVAVTRSPEAIAWGTLAGAIGQLLLQAYPVVRDWRLIAPTPARPSGLAHPGVVDMLRMLVPASLSSSMGTINVAIGTAFCSGLGVGAISVFNYANLLMQLPLGILLTALLVPMFPQLTAAAAAQDRPALLGWLHRGLTTLFLTTLPMTAMLAVLGEPMIRLAFERGRFDAQATHDTALVLGVLSVTIVAYASRDLFTRVFYARARNRVPLLVTGLSIATNYLACLFLVRYGLGGLAAATGLVTVINMTLLGGLLARELGGLELNRVMGSLGRGVLGAALAGMAAWFVVSRLPGDDHLHAVAQLVLGGGAGLLSYLLVLWLSREPWLRNGPWRRARA